MTVEVQFAGNNYGIPEDEETNWEGLTDFLVAVAQNATTSQSMLFSTRIVTVSPANVQATDTVINCNFSAPGIVVLPSGSAKRFLMIADISGTANADNITVNPSGGQQINAQPSYILNANLGAVILHFNGVGWVIVAEFSDVFRVSKKILNGSNASFVPAGVMPNRAGANATGLQSASASFDNSNVFLGTIELDSGEALIFSGSFAAEGVSFLSDASNLALISDAGTGIVVSKPASSKVITVKNRMGGTRAILIRSHSTDLSSIANWS